MNVIEYNEYNLMLLEESISDIRIAKEIKKYDLLSGGYIDTVHESLQNIISRERTSIRPAVMALEETRINNNIEILNELAMEQIKNMFEKFIAVIKSMVQKFIAYSKEQIGKQKKYLQKFKEAILTPSKKDNTPIEMRKYSTGIARISRVRIPEYETAKSKIQTPGDKKACEFQMRKVMIPSYNNSNIDFKDYCKVYFQGGNEVINTNISEINMPAIYNYCNNFGKTMGIIQRDANVLSKLKGIASKLAMNNQAVPTNQQNAQMQSASGVMPQQNTGGMQSAPVQSQPMSQPQPSQVMNAAAEIDIDEYDRIMDVFNEVFNESDGMVVGQPQQPPQQVNAANMNNPQMQAANSTQSAADGNMDIEMNIFNAYKNAATQIISAKMFAANTIYNDYCTLMRTHAPESGSKAKSAKSTSLNIENPQQVAMQVQSIMSMPDQTQQANATASLVAQIQKTNPGFNGGLQDIAKAIGM